jgi:hypothetical protein
MHKQSRGICSLSSCVYLLLVLSMLMCCLLHKPALATTTVSLTSPGGDISGATDVTATAHFSAIKPGMIGSIQVYLYHPNNVQTALGGSSCRTETCTYSYREYFGRLMDLPHGGPYTIEVQASGIDNIATDRRSFMVDRTPQITISNPVGTVSSPQEFTGLAVFKPNNGSGTTGYINAYIYYPNSNVQGYFGTKGCYSENCTYSYQETFGKPLELPTGGPYTAELVASSFGATTTVRSTFCVNDPSACMQSKDAGNGTCNKTNTESSANLKSGNYYHSQYVITKPDTLPFDLSYNSHEKLDVPAGKGWTHNYNF